MTKTVRIENADTSNYKVRVRTYDKGPEGSPDVLVKEEILAHPTAMTSPYITSSRYIVVDEVPATPV